MGLIALTPVMIVIRVLLIGLLSFGSSANAMITWDEPPHSSALVGEALQLDSESLGESVQDCSSGSAMKLGVCNACSGSAILTSGVPAVDSHPTSCELVRIFEPVRVFFDIDPPPPK